MTAPDDLELDKPQCISDPNLYQVLKQKLGVGDDGLTIRALKSLRKLDAKDKGINDISGIELCSNLEGLSLDGNKVSDISTLSLLQKLEILSLNRNPVSDVSSLKYLPELRWLFLGETAVSDLSFVSALPKLQVLSVVGCKVTSLIDLYFCYVVPQDGKRLEKVYAFGNDLDPASIAFAHALKMLDIEIQL